MAEKNARALVAGNWKMNGTTAALKEARLLAGMLKDVRLKCDLLICPPATLIGRIRDVLKGSRIKVGGQDCHGKASGPHTGDIAAEMLKDAGCSAVIVGHSERRTDHCESDAMVLSKADGALRAGLTPIICMGETLEERKSGRTLAVIEKQLQGSLPAAATGENSVIAYEPVWAIGTGLTPTSAEIAEVHAFIRQQAPAAIRILYGGSVKPANAAEILAIANVNGALVGGASLKAADFIGIIKAYA